MKKKSPVFFSGSVFSFFGKKFLKKPTKNNGFPPSGRIKISKWGPKKKKQNNPPPFGPPPKVEIPNPWMPDLKPIVLLSSQLGV